MLTPNSLDEFKYMVSMPESIQKIIDEMRALLASQDSYNHIEIGITEYNIAYPNGIGVKRRPDQHTLECALGIAGALNTFIRNADIVKICNFSDLVNGWNGGCIRSHPSDKKEIQGMNIYGTPAYYVLKMYADMKPKYLLKSNIICDNYQLPELFEYLDSSINPIVNENRFSAVDAVACIAENEKDVVVFAVNRTLQEINLIFNINENPINITVLQIENTDCKAINNLDNKENIIIIEQKINPITDGIEILLKANSINKIIFEFAKI